MRNVGNKFSLVLIKFTEFCSDNIQCFCQFAVFVLRFNENRRIFVVNRELAGTFTQFAQRAYIENVNEQEHKTDNYHNQIEKGC